MRIVLIGAGGHGKVCAEIAELAGYSDILFLDDDEKQKTCGRYPVVGVADDFGKFVDSSTSFFAAIGNAGIRRRVQEGICDAGGRVATLVHPETVVSRDAVLGSGTVVMAGAVINAGAIVGKGGIVNTSSSVDHDCEIGDYCHIAVGAHLSGTVRIGAATWVGAGAVVSNNVDICGGCMIGAGAVVVNHIKEAGTYVGVPAGKAGFDSGM